MIRKLISRVLRLPLAGEHKARPKVIPFAQHGIRRDQMSSPALKVVAALQQAGFQAFIVGGAVRDALLGLTPKDFDVATNATPEQVHHLFRRSRIIGRRFRIVHVTLEREVIEVTTFRGGQESVTDAQGRILHDNVFGSQAEDASRRDFTANALFFNPTDETIIDYHHGVRDIKQQKLVMIGNPTQRYREDPVRLLRAVRLSAKLGLEIDDNTRKPIAELAGLLRNVPAARLFDEMLKMMFSGHAYACIRRLRSEGLHHGIFPLLDAIGIDDEVGHEFVRLALESTDSRVQQDKPVSVGFLLAALLWHQVRVRWQTIQEQGEKSTPALFLAMSDVEAEQDEQLAIPRRFSATMREIWATQPRFEQRSGQRPFRLLEHPRFRAGYDFLVLRAEAGEVDAELAQWWETFQFADPATQQSMLIREERHPRKRPRQRQRRKPSAEA